MRRSTILRGHVESGVIVLDGEARHAEGTMVNVQVVMAPSGGSVLDILPVSIGAMLRPLTSEDDLLGEMLEDRF